MVLDINMIVNNKDKIQKLIKYRNCNVDLSKIISLNNLKKQLNNKLLNLNTKKNNISRQIKNNNKDNNSISTIISNGKKNSIEIKKIKDKIKNISTNINELLYEICNIQDDDVPNDEDKIIKTFGKKPEFNFTPKNHIDIANLYDLIDYSRGAKVSGNGYWIYKNKGAIIEWALINFFIKTHIDNEYIFLLPPHILLENCGYIAGQFPKFKHEVLNIKNIENNDCKHFLVPTAETVLSSIHENEIFNENELPKKYFSYTPCYRSEIGSYRKSERGIIRGHQFNKVEIFQITKPNESNNALEEMLNISEKLVQDLGLHYRISKLASYNCSFAMSKTYDIEVWIPSINCYKEVSSCSNAKDYQARRGNIRFKQANNKNAFVHTLNASSLATSRILPAILETYQQQDGSIIIPEKLRYFTGFDKIS